MLTAFGVLLTLVIGLRFEVGMDWGNYITHLDNAQYLTWDEAVLTAEPAYGLINWISAELDLGVWVVDLVCAAAFATGLVSFCRRTPDPWLAVTVAMPYMAIVMAMNYTRQGAAFGLVLLALVALHDGKMRRFVAFIAIAALFHRSAAVLMPLGAMATHRSRFWSFVWIAVATLLLYVLLISENQEALIDNYLRERQQSDGSWIRVAMNAAAAVTFLLLRKRMELSEEEQRFWGWYALLTLGFIPAMIVSPSTTAVDRVALYFMPLQLLSFGHLPHALRRWRLANIGSYSVVVAYSVVLFVWLNYSNYYYAWIPYRFYPLVVLNLQ